MDIAILLTQIDITCSFNYLGNILRHGCINPFSSDSYRLPLIKSCCNLSEINVTCLSHVSFLETGQNSLFVYLYVCPQPVYRSSVLFCFHTALVPFFLMTTVYVCIGSAFYMTPAFIYWCVLLPQAKCCIVWSAARNNWFFILLIVRAEISSLQQLAPGNSLLAGI